MTITQIISRLEKMLQQGGVEDSYAREEITRLIADIKN